jgi:flagellar export protein FliJ
MVFCQKRVVQLAAERRAKKTAEVVEASKNRKVLERLKEYKAAEHRKEFEREDQNFLDGLATCKHARSINNGDFNESGAR